MIEPGKTRHVPLLTADASTGQPVAPDALPTVAVYHNGVVDATVTSVVTLISTGRYSVSIAVPATYDPRDSIFAIASWAVSTAPFESVVLDDMIGFELSADVNQEPISPANTWILTHDDVDGWENTAVKTIVAGLADDFAVDFRNWLSSTGAAYLIGTPTISIFAGTAGGVTFANEGKVLKQAKGRLTGVTLGDYTLKWEVTGDSGQDGEGRVAFRVIAAS